jgi:hypothetical protein
MDFAGHGRDAARERGAASDGQGHAQVPTALLSAHVITPHGRDVAAAQAAGRPGRDATSALAAVSNLPSNAANGVVTRVELGPDRLVHLPADTSLQSIHISGRDLVVQLPDGSKIIILDGAITPPHLVIGDVDVPIQNLAALLIDSEVQATAGPPQSAGGDFAVPPGQIGPGFGISPLLPPNSLSFGPPEQRQLFPG